MCGLDQPEPGSVAHDPWTAGCFQSPARTAVSLHVSCSLQPYRAVWNNLPLAQNNTAIVPHTAHLCEHLLVLMVRELEAVTLNKDFTFHSFL